MHEKTRVMIGLFLLAAISIIGAIEAQSAEKLISRFECRGNEPFWQLNIKGDAAEYSRFTGAPEMKKKTLIGKLKSLDYLRPTLFVWRGRAEDISGDVVAFIENKQCLDTMSDREGRSKFDYIARISMPDGEVLLGCCSGESEAFQNGKKSCRDLKSLPVTDLSALPADSWPRFLFNLMPAIRACLERTDGSSKWVTKAWPMSKGMAGVRMGNPHGDKWECIAEQASGDIQRFKPLPPNTPRLPGEGMVIFTPENKVPPAGECYEHERVLDANGNLEGWLSFSNC